MPLLAYFGVVGSILAGLLYVAEAQLGPPKTSSVSTNFHGLPAPFKAPASTRVLTAQDAPAPDLSTVATVQPAAADARAAARSTTKVAGAKTQKKSTKTVTYKVNRNQYAHTYNPRPFGFVW